MGTFVGVNLWQFNKPRGPIMWFLYFFFVIQKFAAAVVVARLIDRWWLNWIIFNSYYLHEYKLEVPVLFSVLHLMKIKFHLHNHVEFFCESKIKKKQKAMMIKHNFKQVQWSLLKALAFFLKNIENEAF